MNDIISLELTPDWDNPDVRPRLVNCLKRANALRSAVAYWTVPPDFVHQFLADRLSEPRGFLCVDIHLPTDIDQLASLVRRGASVRIFCEDIPTRRDDKRKEETYLVHAKMLLFWMPDRTAELWIGSHNWTRRALIGLNVEASLIVRMTDSCALFFDAVQYLEKVKGICQPFDLSQIEFYKKLQRKQDEETEKALELEAADADSLQGAVITIFGTDPDELEELGVLRDVCVSVFEESGNGEHTYRATVIHLGIMPNYASAATGLSFAARRYAFRRGRTLPRLLPILEVSQDILRDANYFIVLDMQKYERDLQAFDPPLRTDAWEERPAMTSPLLSRLNQEQIRTLFRNKRAVVRVPTEPAENAPQVADVAERRALRDHRLIVRKVLRPRK